MKNLAFLIFILVMILQSCTITQEIHFYDDFSGKYKLEYDFGQLIDIYKKNIVSDSLLIMQNDYLNYFDSIKFNLKNIEGISKIEMINNADVGVLIISFHFEDIISLNKSLINVALFNSDYVEMGHPFFKQKRRKLFYYRPPVITDINIDNSLNEIITKKLIITFDRKPITVIIPDNNIKIRKNGKEIVEKESLKTISNKESVWEFRFYRFLNIFPL